MDATVNPTAACADPQESVAQTYERILASLENQTLYRSVLLQILELCRTERFRCDVEAHVDALPQMATAPRKAASLVEGLVRSGGLELTVVADELRMSVREYQRAVEGDPNGGLEPTDFSEVSFLVSSTEAGLLVAEDLNPRNRLEALFATHPTSVAVFKQVLHYCNEPRSFSQVKAHLQELGYATAPNKEGKPVVNPSFVLENLQAAGAVWWKEGWQTTEDGAAFLAEQDSKDLGQTQRTEK